MRQRTAPGFPAAASNERATMRVAAVAFTLSLILAATACISSDAENVQSTATMTPEPKSTLTTAIGWNREFQIAYVAFGALPGEHEKTFVWRQAGEDRRWDFIWTLPDETEAGIFWVESGFAGEFGPDASLSCEWFGVAPRSRMVEAQCSESSPSTLGGLVRTLHLPLTATGERQTYAGREGDCFEMHGSRGEEGAVCLDDTRLPLMLAGRESQLTGLQVIDAVHIREGERIESFTISSETFHALSSHPHTYVQLEALLVPLDYLPDRMD